MLSLYRPETLTEAAELAAGKKAEFIAGGTNVMVLKSRNLLDCEALISLNAIPELKGIRQVGEYIEIGALTTFSEIEESEIIEKYLFALRQAAYVMGGPQIRNRATLGGNIASASPSADGAPALLACGAKVRVFGADGEKLIELRNFFIGPGKTCLEKGDIIISILVPVKAAKSNFIKVGSRNALSVSAISMAVYEAEGRISVAVGSAAPTPLYLEKTGELLSGEFTKELISRAGELAAAEISPIDDRWGTASYKRKVCKKLLVKSLELLREA